MVIYTIANIKIPINLLKSGLSPTTLIVFGEIYGLYYKNHNCFITDKSLSDRLNRSTASIQRAMHELKRQNIIVSKQKPNYRGRNITVLKPESNKFILIPVNVARDKRLKTGSIILFGLLYALQKKIKKINADKHLEMDTPFIEVTKSSLAKDLNKTPEYIRKHLIDLWNYGYLGLNRYNGIGIEIQLNEDADNYTHSKVKKSRTTKNNYLSFKMPLKKVPDYLKNWKIPTNKMSSLIQKIKSFTNICANAKSGLSNDLPTERVATYQQNEYPPTNGMSSHLPTKRATNILSNRVINKGDSFYSSSSNQDHSQNERPTFIEGKPLTKPIYYEGILSEDDIPPIDKNFVNESDITELNKLDSASKCHIKQTSNKSAKSGLERKQLTHNLYKKDNSTNYQLSDLKVFTKEVKKILHEATGKNYIITQPACLEIAKRLYEGYTLKDFKQGIYKYLQENNFVNIKQVAMNLKQYIQEAS